MFIPYTYQTACLDAIDAVVDEGAKRALIVMASGLGKTVTMAFSAERWYARGKKGRTLFICHNNDILEQAKTTFQVVNGPQHTYGSFHGGEKNLHHVDFLFASFQTMEGSRDLFDPTEFEYIIVDESHHAHADTFRSTIEYFRPAFLLGATATPDRLDMRDIRELFGAEVFYLPLEEALVAGFLTPVDYRLLADEIVLKGVIEHSEGRRISLAELNRTIFIPRRDEEVADIIARQVASVTDPRVMIFCTSIRHCEHLAHFVPDSFAIHSKMPEKERAMRLEMFRQGIITTVLTVDAFNEGIDIPQANVVVFLRSTSSRTIFLQQLGRGLRRSHGKEKVVALDFVANCDRIEMVHQLYEAVNDVVTRPTDTQSSTDEKGKPMTLNMSDIEFQERIIPLLKLIERVRPNFYPTWQEAGNAARDLSFKSSKEYRRRYREDPRLPANPPQSYSDFPGWLVFLGKAERDFYETWQQASQSAKSLEIRTKEEYRERYTEDPLLPVAPEGFYEGFPGWGQFLGTWRTWVRRSVSYPTWREAASAAKQIGITKKVEYRERYKQDPRLPSSPMHRYRDFPGWKAFLEDKV